MEGKGYQAIGTALNMPKATVQGWINQIKKNGQVAIKKPVGKQCKLNRRCGCPVSDQFHNDCVAFRYLNALHRLASKHPFWGCQKLADQIFSDIMAAHAARPEGARFQVRCGHT